MSAALQEDDPPIGDLVARYYRMVAERDSMDQDIDTARRQITARMEPGERWTNDDGIGVSLGRPTYKFNPARAAIVLAGTEWLASVVKSVPDRELAERYLPNKLYRACCTEIAPILRRVVATGRQP